MCFPTGMGGVQAEVDSFEEKLVGAVRKEGR